MRYCSRCGSPVPSESRFCPVCGQLMEKPKEEPLVKQVTQQTPTPYVTQLGEQPQIQTKQSQLKWPEKCPNCSVKVSQGEKYCPNCGFNLEAFIRRTVSKAPKLSYYGNKRRFFSFEGYELDGVVPAASMYLLWGIWNLIMAFIVMLNQTVLFFPFPFTDPPLSYGLLFGIAIILFSAATGLLIVNTPLYILGMLGLATMLPISLLQLLHAITLPPGSSSPTGTHQLENVMSGIIGIVISLASLLQSIRIRKYFFGEEESK